MIKMVRLADYVMTFLESIGVKDIFMVPGGGAIFLNDAVSINNNLKYHCCHHEQAATMAAEAYARVKEDLGVTLVTTGPGGTNTITGVAGSWMDSIPHLILSGQVFLNQTIRDTKLRQMGSQEINIIDIVKPITKYAVMIKDPLKIKYHLQKAIYLAKSGRPGPVWLDIPANIQMADIDVSQMEEFAPEVKCKIQRVNDLNEKVSLVVKLLRNAKRPLIHAGYGIKIAKAEEEFFEIINRYKIPVVTSRNANDLINSDHQLFVGRPGTFAQRSGNFAVQNADFYLAIGTRLSLPQTGYDSKDYARNAIKVMVDIDPAELEKDTLAIDIKINHDAKEFLTELSRQLKSFQNINFCTMEWVAQCQKWKKEYPVVRPESITQKNYVDPYHFTDILSDVLSSSDIIVTDMGTSFQAVHQVFKIKKGQKLFTNCGMASMGWGLPAAVGACIANNKERVICISGDGGLQMNIQELATIMHKGLPIKTFIFNNKGYITMKESQYLAFGRIMGCNNESGIGFPNFLKIAEAHNIKAIRIENHQHLKEKIKEIIDSPDPAICELMTDPDLEQISRFLPRKNAEGKKIPTPIEDLYPHLNLDELKRNMVAEKN